MLEAERIERLRAAFAEMEHHTHAGTGYLRREKNLKDRRKLDLVLCTHIDKIRHALDQVHTLIFNEEAAQ